VWRRGGRACVRVYARVLVPPNLYIHTYIQKTYLYLLLKKSHTPHTSVDIISQYKSNQEQRSIVACMYGVISLVNPQPQRHIRTDGLLKPDNFMIEHYNII